jgi:hypothetical protein
LTLIQTCRAQGHSAFEFFKQALMSIASPEIQAMSSLIPESNT